MIGWVIGVSVGLGITIGSTALLVLSYASPKLSFKISKPKAAPDVDNKIIVAGLAGAVCGITVAWGSQHTFPAGLIGTVVGSLIYELVMRLKRKTAIRLQQQEVVLLFDAIELYMQSGISMYSALEAAKTLTPNLRPAINKCLLYWPADVTKALRVLRKELNLPEGDILVSLLMQIEYAGSENLQGIMQKESRRIEQIQEAAERTNISLRPLYLVLYRALPLLAVVGMFAGTMFMRTYFIFKDAMSFV